MRTDIIKLSVTVALSVVLAGATIVVYQPSSVDSPQVTADHGSLLFQAKGCSGCHTIAGVAESATIGPNLTNLADVAGERIPGVGAAEYVTQSIREPQAFTVAGYGAEIMPLLPLSDAEIETLVEFLLFSRQP